MNKYIVNNGMIRKQFQLLNNDIFIRPDILCDIFKTASLFSQLYVKLIYVLSAFRWQVETKSNVYKHQPILGYWNYVLEYQLRCSFILRQILSHIDITTPDISDLSLDINIA